MLQFALRQSFITLLALTPALAASPADRPAPREPELLALPGDVSDPGERWLGYVKRLTTCSPSSSMCATSDGP